MPILCSTDRKFHSIKRSKNFVSSNHLNPIHSKEAATYIAPEEPLHLSANIDGTAIILTSETMNLVERTKNSYSKYVFTYSKEKQSDNTLKLTNIAIDEAKSKFYYATSGEHSDCTVEGGREYTYAYLFWFVYYC